MLIAMESSCMLLEITRLRKRRHGCLAQADTSVIGRDGVIRPDLDRFAFKFFEIFQQQFVLENSAGENYGIEIVSTAYLTQCVPKADRHTHVEGARDFFGFTP